MEEGREAGRIACQLLQAGCVQGTEGQGAGVVGIDCSCGC